MNKCPYCGWEARTDYPVEFWCGSVTNRHRSKTCLALEIGQLKDRVKRLEEAGNRMYVLLDPASICMRTTEMDNALQGWDDAKIGGKEAKL